MKKNFFKLILPAIAAALLSSCIGLKIDRPKDNTNYHVLPPAQTSEKAEGLKEVCVNVFEVRIPSYMARSQIVHADKNSSVIFMADSDLWAEPVQNAATRSVVCFLSEMTNSNNIHSSLVSNSGKNSVALKINILECIGELNGKLNFKAQYSISNSEKTVSEFFAFSTDAGAAYSEYVCAISKALESLSLDICKKMSDFNK